MKDEEFKHTEGRLYNYFKQQKVIQKLQSRIDLLTQQIETIETDIKTTNIHIEPSLNMGVSYGERVQTSSKGTSFAESEMLHQISNLEHELRVKKTRKLKLEAKVRNIQDCNSDMGYNINMLSDEYKSFIEYKYRDCKSIRWIAEEMYQNATTTASRRREEVVENVALWCKTLRM